MRVFVTGGTGFVGSHIVETLLEAGDDPLCLVRESSDTSYLDSLGVETYLGTLDEVEGLRPAVAESDAVVHLAGVVKVREFRDFYKINGEATCQFAELVADENPSIERFVYLSSVAARGPGFSPDEELEEVEPVSHYGKSKLLGEKGVRGLAGEMPVTIFRAPPVYGPRDEEMFRIFQGAKFRVAPVYGDGSARTSVVYVADLADAVVASLEREHESGTVFHIDDGDHYTYDELVEACGEILGTSPVSVPIPSVVFKVAAEVNERWARLRDRAVIFTSDKVAEMEQDNWVCGNRRLRERIDWEPSWPLEEGLRTTADWYRQEGWL